MICTEGVSERGKEASILKEGVFEEETRRGAIKWTPQPPECGSWEFRFGENCQEESRLTGWRGLTAGEGVESRPSDIPAAISKDDCSRRREPRDPHLVVH